MLTPIPLGKIKEMELAAGLALLARRMRTAQLLEQ